MKLLVSSVMRSGISAFDQALTHLWLDHDDGAVQLFASSGQGGGLQRWDVTAAGPGAVPVTTLYGAQFTQDAGRILSPIETAAGGMILCGASSAGLAGYALSHDGIGAAGIITIQGDPIGKAGMHVPADIVTGPDGVFHLADVAGGQLISARMTATAELQPIARLSAEIIDLASRTGNAIVLGVDQGRNCLTSFQQGTDGALTKIAELGAQNGVGLNGPTALERVVIGGTDYAVVAGSNSNSLSVFEVTPDGGLILRDHVIDTQSSRFQGIQALTVVETAGHTFVLAGGADDGLSLFDLLPDGRLIHLQSVVHEHLQDGLEGVNDLQAAVIESHLWVFATGERAEGITSLGADLSNLGDIVSGSVVLQGSDKDDILVAQNGAQLTGGAGADVFVFDDGQTATITDFEAGRDRVDLSSVNMLRNIDQLTVSPTSDGTRIQFRDFDLTIQSKDGHVLSIDDLFPSGFTGPDRYSFPAQADPGDIGDAPPGSDGGSTGGSDPSDGGDGGSSSGDGSGSTGGTNDGTGGSDGGSGGTGGTNDGGGATENGSGGDGHATDARTPPGLFTFVDGQPMPNLIGAAVTVQVGQTTPQELSPDDTGTLSLNLLRGVQAHIDITKPVTQSDASSITVMDALAALRLAVGLDQDAAQYPDLCLAADMTQDGQVNVFDALDILRFSVGLHPTRGPEWTFFDPEAIGDVTPQSVPTGPVGFDVFNDTDPLTFDAVAVLTGEIDSLL